MISLLDGLPSRVFGCVASDRILNEKLGEFMNNVRAQIAGGYGCQNWKDEVGLMA